MKDLRPTKLNDLVGQSRVIECLQISILAARHESKALPHVLLYGPPGLGKTTIASIIANEMESDIQFANGGNCRQIKFILPYISKATENSVLFIDEIHRMSPVVEELLYPVMEDFRLDLSDGETVESIDLPQFTIIGSTTDSGQLSAPLRDRFVIKQSLDVYEDDEIVSLLKLNAKKFGLSIIENGYMEIAKRSRGTPRIANNLLSWVKDFTLAKNIRTVDNLVVKKAMDLQGINELGLNEQDRKYLDTLKRIGKPVGLSTLVSSLNIQRETITEQIEPFLLQQNLIMKTGKGRVLV